MNLFISWSGEKSRALAEALHAWLPSVIQAVKPWMSSTDIDKGARWSVDLANQLKEAKIGIICLTPDNLEAPWLLFEAGALSKKLDRSLVCPYLFDVEPAEVTGPLVQFQASKAVKEDTRQLVHTINRALTGRGLSENQVDTAFEKWWTDLDNRLKTIPCELSRKTPRRDEREMLEEVLALIRTTVRHGVFRREGDPIGWSQLLHVMEGGPRLFGEYRRQYLHPLKNSAQPDLTHILTKLEEEATAIDAEWHSLISRSEALQRRIELLTSRGQENLQQNLMWMAAKGTQDDLPLLQHLRKLHPVDSQEFDELFRASEREIMKRQP